MDKQQETLIPTSTMQQSPCASSTESHAIVTGSSSKVPFGEVQTLVNLGNIHVASPGAPMVVITGSEACQMWGDKPEALAKLVELGMQLTQAAGTRAANGSTTTALAGGPDPEHANNGFVLSNELESFLQKYLTCPSVAVPYLNGIAHASTPLEVQKQIEAFYQKLTDNSQMDRDVVFQCKLFIARLLEYAPIELVQARRSGLSVENVIRRLKRNYIQIDKVKAKYKKGS